MRLFIALDLDRESRRGMSMAMARFRRQCEEGKRDLVYALRWTPLDALHLTVHFLGETDVSRLQAIRNVVGAPVRMAPFEMGFTRPMVFPDQGRPSMIRFHLETGSGKLAQLHDELGSRLASLGFILEDRPFVPHVTLARIKVPVAVDLQALLSTIRFEPLPPCRVDHVTLFRSEPSKLGSIYGAMHRVPLIL
jgi:2'-5' RNA ligase